MTRSKSREISKNDLSAEDLATKVPSSRVKDEARYRKVPRPEMLNFVASFPHCLRFHEVNKLVSFIHPCRFVEAVYRTQRNMKKSAIFHVPHIKTWEIMARKEVAASGLKSDDWVAVQPSSLRRS
jgi:hypothetical protein